MTEEERELSEVTRDLMRISAGTEHVQDIIDDLRQSLETLWLICRRISIRSLTICGPESSQRASRQRLSLRTQILSYNPGLDVRNLEHWQRML